MNKILNKIVWIVILIPAVYLAISWNNLQDSVPLHFDLRGNPDRYGNKNELLIYVIILTAISGFVFLLLKNIFRIDPKRYAAENKERLLRLGFALSIFMAALNCMIIYSGVHGASGFKASFIFGGVGLLFAIIGNYLPNLKPNYFAGFRLPWTLENPENWKKTHALAGKVWFGGGLLLAVTCLLLPPTIAFIVFVSVTAIITIIPCVYSYRLFKEQKKTPINKIS
ncbi:MAG: SdpI family protein [Chitinophagaceae bacterium]